MPTQEIKDLIEKVINETAAPEDYSLLAAYVNEDQGALAEYIHERLAVADDKMFDNEKWRIVAQKIVSADKVSVTTTRYSIDGAPSLETKPPLRLVMGWLKYAAAIIIMIGIGAYIWNTQQKAKPLITSTKPVPVKNDVLPGTQKAILTLSDGKKIELNNAASETIHDQTLSIENNNGQLIYKKDELVVMNTMTTPKGGQYQLTLADGTKVWLNAASSITYPTAFTGSVREVSISGEAYFEVAKNAQQPFLVKTPKEKITVLGTEFNVHAYDDEPSKTSLIEGSVKINERILQPGQAFVDGRIIKSNTEQDIAWKNGLFNFNDLSLASAMRQIARWYDVEIIYEGKVPHKILLGKIDRTVSLNELLQGLDGMGAHFMLNGRTVHISPM